MKVEQLMERAGISQTGRAIAYIKEALNEIAIEHETHVKTVEGDIVKDQRFYDLPKDCVKILDIRCKNHGNTEDEFRTIPRSIYEPHTKDPNGV
jgi:hypothetical protein